MIVTDHHPILQRSAKSYVLVGDGLYAKLLVWKKTITNYIVIGGNMNEITITDLMNDFKIPIRNNYMIPADVTMEADQRARFNAMLQEDRAYAVDKYKGPFFYLLACCDELYNRRNRIYDFKNHRLAPGATSIRDLSRGGEVMLKRALHFYNHTHKDVATGDLYCLDPRNAYAAIMATAFYLELVQF